MRDPGVRRTGTTIRRLRRSVLVRVLVLLLAAPVLTPAVAHARPAIDAAVGRAEVRFGAMTAVSGRLHDRGAPLALRVVQLEGRLYPFDGPFRRLARAGTDAAGRFSFERELARNAQLRVSAPGLHLASPVLETFTYPAFRLTYRARRPGIVELVQQYRVPRAVRLSAPTRFYLGARSARRSSLRRTAPTRRVRAGRYRSQVTITLPRAWGGRFRFGSCFATSAGSGMGRADASCPARYSF
jgi:hypothetical protein